MTLVNRNFGCPTDDGLGYKYAPVIIAPNPGVPSEAEYNAAGWYRNAILPPEIPEGMQVATSRYVVEDNQLVAKYTYEDLPPPTLEDFDNAMEQHLKAERDERGYTTREPDSYLTSSMDRWAQDARDWVAHRDAVMEYALGLINAVESGEREPPTMEEFVAGLPKIVWTYTEEG